MVLVLDDVHELPRDCIDTLEPIAKHLPDGRSSCSPDGRRSSFHSRVCARRDACSAWPGGAALSDSEAKGSDRGRRQGDRGRRPSSLNRERRAGSQVSTWRRCSPRKPTQTSSPDSATIASWPTISGRSICRGWALGARVPGADVDSRPDVRFALRRAARPQRLSAQAGGTRAGDLFLVPLDHRREWYRYRHLFRDTLRAAAPIVSGLSSARAPPRSFLVRAERPAGTAIEHMAAAGDMDEVARLVGMFALPITGAGVSLPSNAG